MITKEKVVAQMSSMPDSFSIDELMERLVLVEKIENGLNDVSKGRYITEDKLDSKMEEWFK